MRKDSGVYLDDIRAAVARIEEYLDGVSLERLRAEPMRLDAVIRQLEVIGEAANRLPGDFLEAHPDFPVREAVAMRNFLIHDYGSVDIDTVWETALKDLPLVKEMAERASGR